MATVDRNGTRHLSRVESALRLTDRGRAHVREWRGEPCEGVIRLTAAELADAVAEWARRGTVYVTPPHVLAAIDPAAGSGAWLTYVANPPYGEPS